MKRKGDMVLCHTIAPPCMYCEIQRYRQIYRVSRNSPDKRRPEIPQIILRQFNPNSPSPKMLPKGARAL